MYLTDKLYNLGREVKNRIFRLKAISRKKNCPSVRTLCDSQLANAEKKIILSYIAMRDHAEGVIMLWDKVSEGGCEGKREVVCYRYASYS